MDTNRVYVIQTKTWPLHQVYMRNATATRLRCEYRLTDVSVVSHISIWNGYKKLARDRLVSILRKVRRGKRDFFLGVFRVPSEPHEMAAGTDLRSERHPTDRSVFDDAFSFGGSIDPLGSLYEDRRSCWIRTKMKDRLPDRTKSKRSHIQSSPRKRNRFSG